MIKSYYEKSPQIHEGAFIADSADIIGEVEVGKDSSVWYRAVLRGDMSCIKIGRCSNVQDGAIIHTDSKCPAIIGDEVTIGHNAVVHGAVIKNNSLIGMGAIILNNAVIGENSIIGASSIVTENKVIPPGSLVLGIPGRVIRSLTQEEIASIGESAAIYAGLKEGHKDIKCHK